MLSPRGGCKVDKGGGVPLGDAQKAVFCRHEAEGLTMQLQAVQVTGGV